VLTVIDRVVADEDPHELFDATLTFPLAVLAVVVILFELEVPVHPPGKLQLYEVAPATVLIEYVFVVPEHIVAVPEIVPGIDGTKKQEANFTKNASPEPVYIF
jgi:hypothetical protein